MQERANLPEGRAQQEASQVVLRLSPSAQSPPGKKETSAPRSERGVVIEVDSEANRKETGPNSRVPLAKTWVLLTETDY